MEILGIGPSELLFVVIIAIIILGPRDMQKAGKAVGSWLNRLVHSDSWRMFQETSREVRNLPTRLMRDANDELSQVSGDLRAATRDVTVGTAVQRPMPNSPSLVSTAKAALEAHPAPEDEPTAMPAGQDHNA